MTKLIVLLGVVGVSFSAIFVRLSDAPALTLVFYRMAIAAVLTAPAMLARRRAELARMTRREVLLCLVSGFFLGLHFTAYFTALARTSISSAVVLVDTEVFFVAIAGALFLGERVTGLGWLGIGLTFCGSAVIALGDAKAGAGALTGDLLALAGSVCMAVYTLIGRAARRTLSAETYTTLIYTVAALTVALLGLAGGRNVAVISPRNLLIALAMAVVCTVLGHSVFSWALKYERAVFVSNMNLLEPVLASLLGWLIFRERPGAATAAGGALIIAGILWYTRFGERKESHGG